MRKAIIDCGTNTFNLLIAETDPVDIIHSEKIPVLLGEGGIDKCFIREDAFNRGIAAMQEYQAKALNYGCESIRAYATSAVRSAKNGKAFTEAVYKASAIQIETIDGNREAELIYKGVTQIRQLTQPTLIMDIGGGSTELIFANPNGLMQGCSLPLGVSRLKEVFKPTNPIKNAEISKLTSHIDGMMTPIKDLVRQNQPTLLIGCSGSFETFAEMIAMETNTMDAYENRKIVPIDHSTYMRIHQFLLYSTYEQRLKTPGIIPLRAKMINLASILTHYVLEITEITEMELSKYALKEGLLSEILNRQKD